MRSVKIYASGEESKEPIATISNYDCRRNPAPVIIYNVWQILAIISVWNQVVDTQKIENYQ